MGVVYGAASLWQWRLHPDEPGHSEYFLAPGAGWREALDFEGSTYVGCSAKILAGLPTTDMRPDWTRVISGRALTGADRHADRLPRARRAWCRCSTTRCR